MITVRIIVEVTTDTVILTVVEDSKAVVSSVAITVNLNVNLPEMAPIPIWEEEVGHPLVVTCNTIKAIQVAPQCTVPNINQPQPILVAPQIGLASLKIN